MRIRVIIADDEPFNRERLRQFLSDEPDAELVGECADGLEALELIRKEHPHLVLLDVKMPGLDGFEVIKAVRGQIERTPAVIFVTAHDQFAVRAFDANAIDYLLKPFDQERFRASFRRARDYFLTREQKTAAAPLNPLQPGAGRGADRRLERLAIRSGNRIALVDLVEIEWVQAADNYVELHVGPTTHLLRMTLTDLADQLPPNQFARISRSHLVNLASIRELRSKSHGDYLILLHDGTELPGSRNFRQNLTDVLGKR